MKQIPRPIEPRLVAAYFEERIQTENEYKWIQFPISYYHLKIQRCCYYAQVWYLALYEKPLISGDFEAWPLGPLHYDIYKRYRKFHEQIPTLSWLTRWLRLEKKQTEKIKDTDILEFLNIIWDRYGRLDDKVVQNIVIQEDPWLNNHTKRGIIPHDEMIRYYKPLLLR